MRSRWNKLIVWVGAGLILAGVAYLVLTPYFKGNLVVNPVLVNLGGFPIYWYGLTMALAVFTAFWWFSRRASSALGEVHTINLSLWLVVSGVIGARLLFLLLKLPEFINQPWWTVLNLHSGGLSIHGALIFGLLALVIYTRRHHLPLFIILDKLVPTVVLGQIIGRLGNFFNQEAFGGPTNLPWKMWVAPEFRPSGFADVQFFHPTFLYSMVGLAIVLMVLLIVERRAQIAGAVFLTYLVVFSAERFVIEFFRVDSDRLSVLTWAQWASLVVIMLALLISLIWRYKLKIKR